MDGILNINKPRDVTSYRVVARVKGITRERHTGHAGTLDPQATGVLPICLGQATRVIEFLFDETKTYRAEVELGVATDTYDATGKVLRISEASGISLEQIESTLEKFRGLILQTPPMYSAIKHKGKPLYKLARSGIEIERKSRPAKIDSLQIVAWQSPVVTLDIVCGKGTYIRSLAHDLGEALGCGANMRDLVRLRVGPFGLEDALTLPQLEEAFRQGWGEKYLYPLDYVLSSYKAVVVSREEQNSLINGMSIALDTGPESFLYPVNRDNIRRAYTEDGRFLGMVKYNVVNNRWHPEKVFLKNICQHK